MTETITRPKPDDRGQNVRLFRSKCPKCEHPVSARTRHAMV